MRLQELLQALPNSCPYKLNMKKSVETLLTRGEENTNTLLYKMYTIQTPPYLSTLVPHSVDTFSIYSVRNSSDT